LAAVLRNFFRGSGLTRWSALYFVLLAGEIFPNRCEEIDR